MLRDVLLDLPSPTRENDNEESKNEKPDDWKFAHL
jgi:hypothetical protein